jgi:hypothetical protein
MVNNNSKQKRIELLKKGKQIITTSKVTIQLLEEELNKIEEEDNKVYKKLSLLL